MEQPLHNRVVQHLRLTQEPPERDCTGQNVSAGAVCAHAALTALGSPPREIIPALYPREITKERKPSADPVPSQQLPRGFRQGGMTGT